MAVWPFLVSALLLLKKSHFFFESWIHRSNCLAWIRAETWYCFLCCFRPTVGCRELKLISKNRTQLKTAPVGPQTKKYGWWLGCLGHRQMLRSGGLILSRPSEIALQNDSRFLIQWWIAFLTCDSSWKLRLGENISQEVWTLHPLPMGGSRSPLRDVSLLLTFVQISVLVAVCTHRPIAYFPPLSPGAHTLLGSSVFQCSCPQEGVECFSRLLTE